MGLKGNLSTVNLADVFQVLSRGNSTGLLRIQAPEGPRYVEIQNGAISVAGRSSGRILLGDLLKSRGLITDELLEQALQVQRESSKMLGQVLIDLGMCTLENLEEALRFQIEEDVCELFTLGKGDFDFLAGAALDAKIAPGGGLVRLSIDPNSLLLEAARRADEWKAIEKRIPNQGFLLKLTAEGSKTLSSGEGLSPEGLVLLRLVQETRTIEAMVQKACLGRLNTNQMLIELWDAGLIEPLPVSEYEKAARSHLKLKRVEEAERLAAFVNEFGGPTDKGWTESLLKEASGVKKTLQTQSGISMDPKVRSEVIRRNAPNLILKKERSWLPYAMLVGLIVLGAGGYFGYSYLNGNKQVDTAERKRLSVVEDAASADLQKKNYTGALESLRTFHSSDPDTEKLGRDKFDKMRNLVEAEMRQAILKFNAANQKGTTAEKDAAIKDLSNFEKVGSISSEIDTEFSKTQSIVKEYQSKQRLEGDRTRFKQMVSTGRSKTSEAQQQELEAFLKENPPEEVAADIREHLSQVLKLRNEADRRLHVAEDSRAAGDVEYARQLITFVKRDPPASDYEAKADAGLAGLDTYFTAERSRLDKIEILVTQKQIEEAKAALTKFLDEHPPQLLLVQALNDLQSIVPDPDELTAEFAALKGRRDTPDGRKKLVELLQKAPYSKAAAAEMLKVNVTSDPPNAEVLLNSHTAGRTPCAVDIPAVGLSRFMIRKPGYQNEELLEYSCRKDSLDVTLSRIPIQTRRLPAAAKGGLAVDSENVVAITAEEAIFCARADLKVVRRVPHGGGGAQKPDAVIEDFNSVALSSGYLLMGLADKSVGMITYSDTQYDYARIPIIQTLTAPPVVFKSKQVPGKRLAALGMEQSYGCIVIEDAQAILGNAFPGNEKGRPSGVINHDDMVYVAHGEMLTAMLGHSGLGKWNSNVESPIVGSPAFLKGTLAVVNANGRMFVYDAETGNKRFTREITPPSMGLVTAGIGFITLLKSGKAELYAPDQLASSTGWSVNLAGEIALPALSVRTKNENDTEKSVVYFTHDKDVYTASLLNIANGATIWRSRLSGKPVAAATGNDRIYVATDDTLVSVYESN